MIRERAAELAALIPAWNPGTALQQTLDSIARQDIEVDIYVVDDGSQPALCLNDEVNGKPIHLIRLCRNRGITEALNRGLEQILEKPYRYVSRHDCGDLDHPDRLRLQQQYLDTHPEVALVGSSVTFEDSKGKRRFDFRAPTDQQQIQRHEADISPAETADHRPESFTDELLIECSIVGEAHRTQVV